MTDNKPNAETKKTGVCPAPTRYSECSNMKEVGGDFECERYSCEVCGQHYTLYYEDMA